jgi:site-specific DNA-methyltransferase (cytosine-N4-specific)
MGSERDRIHAVHPYPCKFPPETARQYLESGLVVLDPFCGSGTTLVEAALGGSCVRGFDCNPIAVVISRFKLIPADARFFCVADTVLAELQLTRSGFAASDAELPPFKGRDHWFAPVVQRELAAAVEWIEKNAQDADITLWLQTALSSIINRVSFQDSETRYARVEREFAPGQVTELFLDRACLLLRALRERGSIERNGHVVDLADVMDGIPLPSESVDLIVTSPPYANTMDYYLYHKQRMNVLGFDFKLTQHREIGSRWEFSSLKRKREKWDEDYGRSLAEMHRVLKPGGRAVVIIGDSQIAGELINAAELTARIATDRGLTSRVLESTPLAQRSRSFNPGFQRPNKFEHVLELTK